MIGRNNRPRTSDRHHVTDSQSNRVVSDYLRVLRAHRLMIALAALVAVGVATGLSLAEAPTYQGRAALLFRDMSADLNAVGSPAAPSRTQDEIAALGAQTAESPGTLMAVKRALRTPLSLAELESAVSTTPQADSNLVLVDAKSSKAQFASRLANAVAQTAARRQVTAERRRFASAAAALRRQLGQLGRAGRDPGTRSVYAGRILALQSLSTLAQPVEVAESAQVPSSPISPKPVRNAALAAILGLLLGIMFAFLRHSLDPKLRGSREIQEELGLPLVGHVREEAMGTVGYVDTNGDRNVGNLDLEAFRILRTNLEFLDPESSISSVVITSALPEEGKSTVAASLALASAAAGRSVLLVECDLRRPSLSDRLGLRRAPGLTDYLTGTASPAEVVQFVNAEVGITTNGHNANTQDIASAAVPNRLACVMAGRPTAQPTELLSTERFRTFLREVTPVYELVVVDASPLLPVADTLAILPYVDALLLCVRDGRTTRRQAMGARAALGHLPERPTGLVVTGISKGHEDEYGYYSYAHAYEPQ